MKILDIFKRKKKEPAEVAAEEQIEKPEEVEVAQEQKPEDNSSLPACPLCGESIREKPIKFKYNHETHFFHKRCMRKIRRHPERYAKQ